MIHTAEFVSKDHPDKVCDRISDAILDVCLTQDPLSRVAVETMGGHGIVTVTGELTTNAFVDIPSIVQAVYGKPIGVQVNLTRQSNEIARGVDTGGAGDQGIMVGYACSDTKTMMPLEYELARSLNRHLYGIMPADGKTQITIEDGEVSAVLASWCGMDTMTLYKNVSDWANENKITAAKLLVNPAGDWKTGGFDADTGLTGRKIVNDAYGPSVQVGGGAYSGKDPTKVDRSAAYMARKIACDVVRNGADEVLVKIAYAIGMEQPLMAVIVSDGIERKIAGYDLRPQAIIEMLDLRKPIYEKTAESGHYGNGFSWDK